jgi:hypothetical protein
VRHSSIDEVRQFQFAVNLFHFNNFRVALDLHRHELRNGMLRIDKTANGDVVFTLSGRIDKEDIAELEALIDAEGRDRCYTEQCQSSTSPCPSGP